MQRSATWRGGEAIAVAAPGVPIGGGIPVEADCGSIARRGSGRGSTGPGRAAGGMWLASTRCMGLGTATIEMENPEKHRERLHDLVKAARSVLVLSCGAGDRIVGQPMVLLRAGDDTTMYVAASLDAGQRAALSRDPRVTVVAPGEGGAMFEAEAVISRDRGLLDGMTTAAWKLWSHSRSDPSITTLVISPIAGAYWEGSRRHAYQYRVAPVRGARELSDGVPVEV